MHNTRRVRRFERFRDLLEDRNGLFDRERPTGESLLKSLAMYELHHQVREGTFCLQPVEGRDARVIQRRENARLALETGKPLCVLPQRFVKDFDRDLAPQLRILRPVDLTLYTQIVFESQRNTNFVFNRSKKGSAPCGKVEFGRRQSLQLRLS